MIYKTIAENIGQVRREQAASEVNRMNELQKTDKWRIDESEEMYVTDETDEDVKNPLSRSKGYVFIVRD